MAKKKKHNQRDPDPEKRAWNLLNIILELIHLIVKDQLQAQLLILG